MKAVARTTLIAAIVLSFGIGGHARAQSSPDVSHSNAHESSIKGTFSYSTPSGDDGFVVSTGTFTFDGKGNVTGTMDLNDDGTLCPGLTLSGTYTMNPDRVTGTAALALTVPTADSSCSFGNNDTLNLSLSLASGTKIVNFAEMDVYTSGTFQESFDPIAGVAVRR